MGLFKKSYVERIKDISERLHEVSLSEDDLIVNFRYKVKEIEEYDIEFIRLLKRLAKEGHLSERMKRILLNQLIVLLRKLEKLKFKNKEQLKTIRKEIESILELELTTERIGIDVTKSIYHGSGIANIRSFQIEVTDYMGMSTLGMGIYCTDNKKMGINYAYYRYKQYLQDHMILEFGKDIKITVYTIKLKPGKNYFADLSDPIKIVATYRDLKRFCEIELPKVDKYYLRNPLNLLIQLLENAIEQKTKYANIRRFFGNTGEATTMAYYFTKFLQSIGFHGLRSVETGEPRESIYPWEPSMSYVIFNPDDIEIIAEEHFDIKNGKVIRIK